MEADGVANGVALAFYRKQGYVLSLLSHLLSALYPSLPPLSLLFTSSSLSPIRFFLSPRS